MFRIVLDFTKRVSILHTILSHSSYAGPSTAMVGSEQIVVAVSFTVATVFGSDYMYAHALFSRIWRLCFQQITHGMISIM